MIDIDFGSISHNIFIGGLIGSVIFFVLFLLMGYGIMFNSGVIFLAGIGGVGFVVIKVIELWKSK